MALDGIILSKVKQDLENYLPIRINRISETSKTEVVFNVHANTVRTNLVISLHSNYNHICLSERNYTTYNDASTFAMVLRKYILNGKILDVYQTGNERIITFDIEHMNEMGDKSVKKLILELMGKYSNVILVEEDGTIIDSIKHVNAITSSIREVGPGKKYFVPDEITRISPYNEGKIDEEEGEIISAAIEFGDKILHEVIV